MLNDSVFFETVFIKILYTLDDVAILSKVNPIPQTSLESDNDVDDCIFVGHLRDESGVRVTLTGGCPFQYSFEVLQRVKNNCFVHFQLH
jgi:hypothetical protein